jgi:hypothetical protein
MRNYLWQGLIIRYVSIVASFFAGVILIQRNVFQLFPIFDLATIASIICLIWFLGSFLAIWAYRCPRCRKRFFKFRYAQVGLVDLVNFVVHFRFYREQRIFQCKHCNLSIWAKSDAGNDSEEGKFTPPLP